VRAGISGILSRQSVLRRSAEMAVATSSSQIRGRANTFAAWLALIGLIIPAAEVQIFVAGAKLPVGRIGIILLFLPALFTLFQRGRRLLLSDLFVSAMAIWILGAALYTDGMGSLSSAGAESLEFLGGYLVARAFFFGPTALHTFLSVLKVLAFTSIVLAMADSVAGRLIVHDTFASLLNVPPIDDQYRMGIVRATSTFDHAILFGTFCAVVAAMLLYSETNVLKRFLWVGFCFFGAILSLSSSSLMALAIMLGTYTYGALTRGFALRWWACWMVFAAFALVVIVATNDPLGWVLSHLTLDPESGYFRLLEWNAALYQISLSPWTGFAFFKFGSAELYSVDCVWLALALRFGIPTVVFLILANITALLPTKQSDKRAGDPYLAQMRTAFSLVLVMFMFVGLTVHYWNYMWIFWGICIGIRASLREHSIGVAGRLVSYSQLMPNELANDRFRSSAQA
jgi:preprotein translocase subunit SecE